MSIAAGIELSAAGIAAICRRHQVKELSLFGSAVRGEMRPDSDIDLLVDFLPGARPGLLGVSAMTREFTALLGRRRSGRQACTEAAHPPRRAGRGPADLWSPAGRVCFSVGERADSGDSSAGPTRSMRSEECAMELQTKVQLLSTSRSWPSEWRHKTNHGREKPTATRHSSAFSKRQKARGGRRPFRPRTTPRKVFGRCSRPTLITAKSPGRSPTAARRIVFDSETPATSLGYRTLRCISS